MKILITSLTLVLALLAGNVTALAQQSPAANPSPAPQEQPDDTPTEPVMDEEAVGDLIQAVQEALDAAKSGGEPVKVEDVKARILRGQSARGSAGSGSNVVSLSALVAKQATNGVGNGAGKLRLNFR